MKSLPTIALLCFLTAAALADDKFTPIDLQPYANKQLSDNDSVLEDNTLASLPSGEQVFGNVKFQIGKKLIQLRGNKLTVPVPVKVNGISVNKKLAKLNILHATQATVPDGAVIGEYRINFDDHSAVIIPIVYGKDVCDWWDWWADKPTETPLPLHVAWKGSNGAASGFNRKICLFMTTWENPWPDKKVETIDYSSKTDVETAPFCVAITAEQK
jgi:hypothetical protein